MNYRDRPQTGEDRISRNHGLPVISSNYHSKDESNEQLKPNDVIGDPDDTDTNTTSTRLPVLYSITMPKADKTTLMLEKFFWTGQEHLLQKGSSPFEKCGSCFS